MTRPAQDACELAAFREFAIASGLPFDLPTAEKRPQTTGEPDILVHRHDEGMVAVEMVRLCDPDIAERVSRLHRGNDRAGGAFYTSDPSTEIVLRKFAKAYTTPHPIDLVCHTDGRIITPPDVIVATLRPLFERNAHPFRNAWLLDQGRVYRLFP